MLSAQQPSSITNSPRSLNQVMQLPKNSISIPNNPLQLYSAPDSPIQPSPRKLINPSSAAQGLSPISNSSVLLPLRMRTENNDNQRPDLFNMRSHTDASDSEECLFAPLENNENIKDKGASRNIQTLVDDIKNRKKAQSAKKSYKCSSPISRSVGLWSKENIDASVPVTEKETDTLQKKYRSSVEKVSRSVGGESQFKSEKKGAKATLADLDVDVAIDENLQEAGVEGLFDEGYMDKERLLKELGPIRYSKMSEEDAATIFEIRRKELLSFLKKLGSSSVARKKSHKYPPLIRSSLTSNNGQSSDAEKMEFPSGKALRCLQDSIKDNASPTRFIIYNTATTESLWNNNNNNSQTNKCVTPAKEKKLALSTRVGCESAPDGKRRDSSKLFKEKEEPNPLIQRNLEANFNQLFEWSDITVEKRSPVKMMKQVENNCEDKNDGIESITIDLTKSSRLKKRKSSKKNKEKSEKLSLSQKVVITNITTGKQWNEDMRESPFWEQQEIQPEVRVNHKAIEEIRKKNQAVMNDIDDIDDQIQRMQESYNQRSQSLRKPINGREEAQRVIVLEANLQEGYSNAAKMKKSTERSRSLSLKLGFKENMKQNSDISGDKCRNGQKSREVIPEEPGSQSSRRNDRVKFTENVEEVRRANAPTPIKLSTEKVAIHAQSQPNTLKFSLTKPVHNKSNERQTPVSKPALSKNSNGSRSALKEMNSNLHAPTNAIAEMNEFRAIELEIARESSALKQAFNSNVKTAQPTVNKTLEINKNNNRPSSLNIRNDLQSPPQKANRISKTTETTSTLQTVREHLLTSPKETVFTLRRTSSKVKSEVFCKREPSSGSIPSAKKITNTPKLPNKSVSIKVNQKAASDKYISEATPIPNLFESNSETNRREPSPAPKISTLTQEKTPVVSAVKPKSAVKRTETPKAVKNTPIQAKKGEANRPNFDTNSSSGIRAKIFRRNQESSAFIKPILSPKSLSNTGTSRLDADQISSPGCGVSPSIQETLRKGSLSTPRGFKLLSSSNIQGGAVAQSLQDLRERLTGKQGVEASETIESLESFRLREKSLNLPLRPGKSLSQAENTVTQIKKDSQTFKRKQTTGYSLSSLNQKL